MVVMPRIIVLMVAVLSLVGASYGFVFAVPKAEERQALEQQLAEYENQIAQLESTVEGYQKQGKTLQKEVDRLNVEISKTNLQIRAVTLSLQRLDGDIDDNTNK